MALLTLTDEEKALIAKDPVLSQQMAELEGIEAGISDLRHRHGSLEFLYSDWKLRPHPKQQEFFQSSLAQHMFSGAQGSGKTYILANIFGALALGRHPTIKVEPPVDLWLVGLSHQKVEQVLLPYFRRSIPPDRILSYDSKAGVMKIAHDSGQPTTLGLMSAEMDVEKFQSNRLDAIGFDEAPPKAKGVAIFREAQSRFKPGRTLYIRLAGTPWELPRYFRTTFYNGAERNPKVIGCTICGLADNPYVPAEQVEFQANRYVGKELRARLFGEFVSLTGVVFDTFDYRYHMVDDFAIPDTWPRYCGIDPTEGRRPWTIRWMTIAPNGKHYVYRELDVAGTYQDIVNEIFIRENGERIQWRAIDPFAAKFNMSTGTDWVHELAKLGLHVRKVDRSKRTMYRSMCNQLLGDPVLGKPPTMFFFRNGASRTAEAFSSHEWDEGRAKLDNEAESEKEADDTYKDSIDAVLYMLALNPRYFNVETYILNRKRNRQGAGVALDPTFGY